MQRAFRFLSFLIVYHITWVCSAPNYLSFNQRYPNRPETDVCTAIRDVIPRNSGRFNKILIRNTNTEALYANEDCRRMTARAKSKLDVLASRIRSKYSSVKVRVIQAWTDNVDPNDRTSLHYEGRSLRLQLSDNDRNKLGYLAGLAIETGFDWVHYVDRSYIKASVKADVCQTSVDLAFMIDGSGSVSFENFKKTKEFIKKVVDFFNIGEKGTHIAVGTYSSSSVLNFGLKQYYTKNSMRSAIDRIGYPRGGTQTGKALRFVKNEMLSVKAGARNDPGIPKVLVFLTDGQSQGENPFTPAKELKDAGVAIFAMGIGSGINQNELRSISSDPDSDYVFLLNNFNSLSQWVDKLSSVSCSEGSVLDSCKNSETSVDSGSFKYFKTVFDSVTGNRVSVEVEDIKGISHLYASVTSRNPGPLDRESVKNENNKSPRAVSLTLPSGTKTAYVAVQGQQNDNKFILSFWDNLFVQSVFTTSLQEGKSPQEVIVLQLAAPGKYSLTYSIKDGNDDNAFIIEKRRPRISSTKKLDREKQSQYDLVIVASDAYNTCHKGRASVRINIGDVNDNKPVWSKTPYYSTIAENTAPGTLVETVLATDKDAGNNGVVVYSIIGGNVGNKFTIDGQNGRITLQNRLDYESKKSYDISLRARDKGNPSKYADNKIIVTVGDVNEQPSIRCDGSCSMRVSENAATGTKIGKVIATDPDGTTTRCSLSYDIPTNAKNTFTVNANGEILTKVQLDRETTPSYVFPVRVKDCGSPRLSDSVEISVSITDVNDNSPIFTGPYTVNVLESKNTGSNILQVQATDKDIGTNGQIKYTIQDADSAIFQINQKTGDISLKNKLDYETKKRYAFTAVATDGGGRKGTTTVTVNVLDVNDNKPVFTNLPKDVTITENSALGSNVFTVTAIDKDSGSFGDVRYSIVGGNQGNKFKCDANSGKITVNGGLDREAVSSYTLTIQASDRGSPSQNSRDLLVITISDINDNSPIFQGLPYKKSVPENLSINGKILKVLATDKDAGNFGKVTYSIQASGNSAGKFKVDKNTGDIRLAARLDYETSTSHSFTIKATDGGSSSTDAQVAITVQDVNDNKPVFSKNPYRATVAENANIGHVIGRVQATDQDSGSRGSITYSIFDGNVANAFSISASGDVRVAYNLDRETRDSYGLTIRAKDNGAQPLFSDTKMEITISDINDNKPVFGKSSYSFTIDENNAKNAVVGKLGPATDKDVGKNAEIGYTIVSGDPSGTFEFQSNGDLVAKVVLDREKTPSYSLVIEARDKGTPSLYSRVPVAVTVQDVNDNSPKFSKDPYNCEISENVAGNTAICFVQARDIDAGKNGDITYQLEKSSTEFSIDQNNGEIKTKVTLDREKKSSYSFEVLAKDGGSPSRSSKVTVNVKVLDKNDNEPVFNRKQYIFEISEDAKLSAAVGKVLATDKDEGLNSKVVYAIISGNVDNAFTIVENTGDIKVNNGLDREKLAKYALTIQASDKGRPVLSARSLVVIDVKDINDNRPKLTKSLYTGKIAEDVSIGSPVVQVKANDADEGNNAVVTYKITSGQNKDHFTVDAVSGLVKTASELDYEQVNSYDLVVTASDKGNPSLSSTSQIKITVINTNDNIPTFVPGSPTVTISEGVAVNTDIIKFNATDKDGEKLSFSISAGNTNNDLKLNADTGLLETAKNLDRETTPFYNLTVTVKDKGDKSSSRNLTVIVKDVNDNRPIFNPSSYTKTIAENTATGAVVTVQASDKDIGDNAKISYSIDAVSSQRFTIDSSTGVISTKSPLDREKGERHVIKVTAEDAGTPSLSSVTEVVVTVSDVNDNRPYFTKDYAIKLRENTATGRSVVRVEAVDGDSGDNGKITYEITKGNKDSSFSINPDDGNLMVAKNVDRETNTKFILTVKASNKVPYSGTPPSAKTTTTITITIEDDNDNAPVITNTVYQFNVEENSKAGSLVVDVDATDKDIGVNGEIQYEITSGNTKNAFQINENTGIVSVKGGLDREVLDKYTLSIKAKDKGTPSLFSVKDFVVKITDLDDNAPVFVLSTYKGQVREDAKQFAKVVQVEAKDKDAGVNGQVKYSLTGGNEKIHFKIDVNNGFISTNALLDYENIKQYSLVVTAKDTKHTATATVKIDVVNVNDNNPVFEPDRYTKEVPENVNSVNKNKVILTIQATDKDPFGGLTYTILNGNVDNKFSLDPSTGELSVAAELDREKVDKYTLNVRVSDGGQPSLTDNAAITISLSDINDNAPQFANTSQQANVKENSPTNTNVLTVTATDRDIGRNAEIQYSITKGNADNKFKLVSDTGELLVNGNIDREKLSSFTLEITAQDKGLPSLKSKPLRVDITVLDENDNDPEFTKSSYSRNITENLSAGTFVEEVVANDKDFGLNAKISYSIQSGSHDHFTIDKDTGITVTLVSLDRENISSYTVVIEAKDHGNPSRKSTVMLYVNVLDVNDNNPVFNLSSLVANVTEAQPKGLYVTTISAYDSDNGPNSEIVYGIDGNNLVDINPVTGVVRTLAPLDYERETVHRFPITATDKGQPSLTSTADLIVNVVDIDDNCPEFSPKVYNVTVEENIATNITIVQVTATDKDSGDNKDLDYGIRDGNDAGSFRIDLYNGVIRASRPKSVDREISSLFHLIVRAGSDYCGVNFTDPDAESTGTKLSKSIGHVFVEITDVNDNPPEFMETSYNYVFTDISTTTLRSVEAKDPDEGLNAEVEFESDLNNVKRDGYKRTLTIIAKDRGTPSLSSNTTFTVTMAKDVVCETMSFDVSTSGLVSVKTLCTISTPTITGQPLVGEAILLNCTARGNTVPEYRWIKNGVPVSDWSKKSGYFVQSLAKEDSGPYSCIAFSSAGSIVSRSIDLNVQEAPSIVLHPKDTWAEIGKESVLHCLAKGDEPIEYSWYKNDILMSSVGDLITDQKDLVFKETIVEDAAKYYCKAKNKVGNDGAKSKPATLYTYNPDSVIEMVATLQKPRYEESCHYFNISQVKEQLKSAVSANIAIVEFSQERSMCNLTKCSSNPCQNQGKCEATKDDFKCICPTGWIGKYCEQDEDECKIETCAGAKCVNRPGSFSCNCVNDTYGKRCQFKKSTCDPNPCTDRPCFPRESTQKYQCISKPRKMSMVFKSKDKRRPWQEWMKYDIGEEIETVIKNRQIVVASQKNKRRRRDVIKPDYSDCSVRVTKASEEGSGVNVEVILVCYTAPSKDFVCQALLYEGKVSSCSGDGGVMTEDKPTTPSPMEPVRVEIAFIARNGGGEETSAEETISALKASDIQSDFKDDGITGVEFKARKPKIEESKSKKLSTGATAGMIIGITVGVIFLIIVVLLLTRSRRRGSKDFGIGGRAILSRTQSTDMIVQNDVSMRELKNADARGVDNKTFSKIYEESDGQPADLDDGSFMVENVVSRKANKEHMSELESSKWYHGSISRSKAEDSLTEEGSYIVRGGLDEREFYISARGSDEEGPKYRHVAVNRLDNGYFVSTGEDEKLSFKTFNELLEHLEQTPTTLGDNGPPLKLKKRVLKE